MTFPRVWDGVSPTRPDPEVQRAPDSFDWSTLIHDHMLFPKDFDAPPDLSEVDVKINGLAMYHLFLTNLVIDIADNGAAGGHGFKKIWNWPSDRPHAVLGPKMAFTFTSGGGVSDSGDFSMAIGSQQVETDDVTLTTTEADLMGQTDGVFVAGTDSLSPLSLTLKSVGTSDGMYLNLAVPDASITADGTITVNGRISFIWTPWYTP